MSFSFFSSPSSLPLSFFSSPLTPPLSSRPPAQPPFRGLAPAFHALAAELVGRAEVVAVYAAEAHATDEWPISSARSTRDNAPVALAQARSTAARAAAAAGFVRHFDFEIRMLVDPVGPPEDGPFDAAFAPWPLRFYCFKNGVLRFKAQPLNCTFDFAELRARALALAVK